MRLGNLIDITDAHHFTYGKLEEAVATFDPCLSGCRTQPTTCSGLCSRNPADMGYCMC